MGFPLPPPRQNEAGTVVLAFAAYVALAVVEVEFAVVVEVVAAVAVAIGGIVGVEVLGSSVAGQRMTVATLPVVVGEANVGIVRS